MAVIITGEGLAGSPLVLRARINGGDGTPVGPSAFTAIKYEVWLTAPPKSATALNNAGAWLPMGEASKILGPITLDDPADAVLEELEPWGKDSTGYNFRYQLAPINPTTLTKANFPAGQYVRIEWEFTPVGEGAEKFIVSFWGGLRPTLFGKA